MQWGTTCSYKRFTPILLFLLSFKINRKLAIKFLRIIYLLYLNNFQDFNLSQNFVLTFSSLNGSQMRRTDFQFQLFTGYLRAHQTH